MASATPVVLKEELITKADRICARAQTDLGNITGSEDQSLPGLVRTLDTGIPLIERAVADIRALYVPEPDRAAFGDILNGFDRQLQYLRDARAAAAAGNRSRAMDALNRETDAEDSVNTKDAFGMKDCGSGG